MSPSRGDRFDSIRESKRRAVPSVGTVLGGSGLPAGLDLDLPDSPPHQRHPIAETDAVHQAFAVDQLILAAKLFQAGAIVLIEQKPIGFG